MTSGHLVDWTIAESAAARDAELIRHQPSHLLLSMCVSGNPNEYQRYQSNRWRSAFSCDLLPALRPHIPPPFSFMADATHTECTCLKSQSFREASGQVHTNVKKPTDQGKTSNIIRFRPSSMRARVAPSGIDGESRATLQAVPPPERSKNTRRALRQTETGRES